MSSAGGASISYKVSSEACRMRVDPGRCAMIFERLQ